MAKRKGIKFQNVHGALRGRQNGMEFWIYKDPGLDAACALNHYVVISQKSNQPQKVSTGGHEYFTQDGAKGFCKQIAAGEIDLEDLQAFYDAEDTAKEQAVVREITEKAKKFRDRLEAAGLSFMDLLELEVLRHGLGEMGHEIMLGYYRGEGWPSGT